jgi:protein-S-isoprenylcysteine O-methyltransferase Ste14
MKKKENVKNKEIVIKKGIVHFVLLHSYFIFFMAVILGVIFDIFMPVTFFQNPIYQKIGILMIFLGTGLIYWAQLSSGINKKINTENLSIKSFENGPYKYFLSPSHLGLFIMTLGLAFILNSLFSIIFVVLAYFLSRIILLRKQEQIFEKKYGQVYLDYKKKYNKWL